MDEKYEVIAGEPSRKIRIVPRNMGQSSVFLEGIERAGIVDLHRELYQQAVDLVRDGQAEEVVVEGGSFQIAITETGMLRKQRSMEIVGNAPTMRVRKQRV